MPHGRMSEYERFVQLQEAELEYLSALRDARSKREYLRSSMIAKAKESGADKRLSESRLEELMSTVLDHVAPLP